MITRQTKNIVGRNRILAPEQEHQSAGTGATLATGYTRHMKLSIATESIEITRRRNYPSHAVFYSILQEIPTMTMMQTQLTMKVLMERGALFAPDTEVVSKMRDTVHRYTYAEMDRRGRQLANALAELGVR